MFTGIITDVGTVRSAEQRGDLRLTDRTAATTWPRRPRRLDRLLGHLPDRGRQGRGLVRGRRLGETVSRTAAGLWREGARLNLERALRSATSSAAISSPAMSMRRRGRRGLPRRRFDSRIGIAPARAGPMIAAKGSIALDGVSLTVNEVRDADDGRPISRSTSSPHRAAHTLGDRGRATAQCRDRRPRPLP
jgi:riboflavin synthase